MARIGFSVFWTKAEVDAGWGEIVTFLRKKKQFSTVVKNGIALVYDLMNGNTDELLRQFPFVIDAICPQQPPPNDSGDMERRIADAVANRLKGELHPMSQDAGIPDGRAGGFPLMQPAPKGLGNYAIAMPIFDDDELPTIAITQSTAANVNGSNLLSGMMGL